VLTSSERVGQLETPFFGVYKKRYANQFPAYNGCPAPNGMAEINGDISVRVMVTLPAGSVTTGSNPYTPVRVRVHRCAGDDFRFIRRVATPPLYWNLWKVKDPVSSVVYDYQMFPSRLFNPSTGWRTTGTAFLKPQSLVQRKPRRTRVVEIPESESDSDQSYAVVGEAHALDQQVYNGVVVQPNSFAAFLFDVHRGSQSLVNVPCGLPVPTLSIDVRNNGHVQEDVDEYSVTPGDRYVTFTYTLAIREQQVTASFRSRDYANLPGHGIVVQGLIKEMLDWAVINANGPIDIYSQLHAWFTQHFDDLETKPAFSLLNEIQQQISGLQIIVSEDPPEGPLHQLQHPVTVVVQCQDQPTARWGHRHVTGSKHSSKRGAAAQVLLNMRMSALAVATEQIHA